MLLTDTMLLIILYYNRNGEAKERQLERDRIFASMQSPQHCQILRRVRHGLRNVDSDRIPRRRHAL